MPSFSDVTNISTPKQIEQYRSSPEFVAAAADRAARKQAVQESRLDKWTNRLTQLKSVTDELRDKAGADIISSGRSVSDIFDYGDASLAEAFGMDRATAYQEALANSAYQRMVADMKKAGLNPVLGINSSGADVFSGSASSSGAGVAADSGSSRSGLRLGIKSAARELGALVTGLTHDPVKGTVASAAAKIIGSL